MRCFALFVAVIAAYPVAAQQYPAPVVGAELASEVSVKLVTDEAVVHPPRRPNDPLYACRAAFRTSSSVAKPFSGELQVIMFSGESQTASAEVTPGIRATLTCAVDAKVPMAGLRLLVIDAGQKKALYSSVGTFWLPPAPSK
jgi:hypothetical protein